MYFEVVREAGPPHMRTFLTKVIVGDFVTEGEGNGKKVSERIDYYLIRKLSFCSFLSTST